MSINKLFSLLFSFTFLVALSFGQNCTGDSVVITKKHQYSPGETYSVVTDTFKIASGINKRIERRIEPTNGNVYTYTNTQNFLRTYIERNSQNDTSNFYSYTGTGSGYDFNEKIIFTYDTVTNFITSRLEYNGTGNTWVLFSEENWIYNSNNKLINHSMVKDTGGTGAFINIYNTSYNYNGECLNDIIFQIGNGNTWVDSYRYIISYDTFGIRDSLATQIRDSLNILWVDDAKFNYDSADNYYVHMPSVKLVYDSGQSQYFTDSTYIVLDTFNLVRSSYHMFDRQQITQYYIYDYFHERQVIIYSNTNDWGCFNEQNISYDTNGVYIGYNGPSTCFMQYYHGYGIIYDSTYRPLSYGTSLAGGCCGTNYNYTYFYANDTSIYLNYLTQDELYYMRCIGNTINTNAIVLGGCGPYHFQWSPSIGLSSDTAKEPEIYLTDTITYFITVTDSLGHTSSTSFFAAPSVIASIADTAYCLNCPAHLTANYYSTIGTINPIYQWFRNDTAIAGATQQDYTATLSGEYTVSITYTFRGTCTSTSHSYFFLYDDINTLESSSPTLYPNPANDHAIINGIPKGSIIHIFDLSGRSTSFEGEWNSTLNQFTINTSRLSASIYFVDVEFQRQHSRLKLAVER